MNLTDYLEEASEDDEDAVLVDVNEDESSAVKAEKLLNEIVAYGLEQSEYLTDVTEKELYDGGVTLTKKNPAHFVAVFNKQKSRAKEISKYAVASLHASSVLARQ